MAASDSDGSEPGREGNRIEEEGSRTENAFGVGAAGVIGLASDLRASMEAVGSLAGGGRDGFMTNGGGSVSGPTSNDMGGCYGR